MQKFLYTLCFCFLTMYASCQITGFGYQGAARDVSGHVIASTQVGLRFSLLEGSVAGAELYVETQSTMTNQQGVFTLTVGNGVGVSGNFNSINWGSTKFLKVEMSVAGAAYVLAGTTQILSAPTAYYSQKAKQLDTSTNIDAGNKNVVNMANPVAAQDAATKNYVDAQIADDNDKSTTNEIQNLDNVLDISNDAGANRIINLAEPIGTQDAATKNYVDTQGALGWNYIGNSISDPLTQFIGTINSQSLAFRSNNIERMRLSPGGNLGIGTNDPLQLLHVKTNNTPSDIVFDEPLLDGFAEISLGSAFEANANNTSNGNGGFAAVVTSGGGSPQYGIIGAAKGANSLNSTGVLATASGSTSVNRGLYGRAIGSSAGSNAYGVQSFANGTNDRAYGGYFIADGTATTVNAGLWADASGVAPFNYGIWARAANSTNVNAAGLFRKEGTAGTDNYGVSAIATAGLTGLTRGGYFEVLDNNGTGGATGVVANVSGTGTGANNGVFATVSGGAGTNRAGIFQKIGTAGTNNYGVAGIAVAGLTGTTRGGYFEVEDNNGTGNGYGIYATINGTGTGTNYGGYFEKTGTAGTSNYGIHSRATAGLSGSTWGGFFEVVNNNGTSSGTGLFARSNGTGNNVGIYAEASGGASNFAGVFAGAVSISGSVSITGGDLTTSQNVTISQSATIGTVLRLTPLSSPPVGPVKGEIYYDNNDNTIKYWNGTVWVTM